MSRIARLRESAAIACLLASFAASAQLAPLGLRPKTVQLPVTTVSPTTEAQRTEQQIDRAQRDGVGVRIKDMARFRGIRTNVLQGLGLVMGLNGTGDSNKVTATVQALANYMKQSNIDVDPSTLQVKNVAFVLVSAQLPPFAVNGQAIDVTVTSLGDAKSLENGTLMMTPLRAAGGQTVYATAAGAISVGGFSVSAGGNSQSKGFVTVGRIPSGGMVEKEAPTTTVYDGKMYLELDEPDIITAHRTEQRINQVMPEYHAVALNGGTIEVDLPHGLSPTTAMARLDEVEVQTDTGALVVINEKTGTIALGGDVRIAPCVVANGSLSVKIEESVDVSQPSPFSGGSTQLVKNQKLTATEDNAQIAVVKPNTTIADLARIFAELKLKPGDIINILQLIRQQGALKARVVTQ